MKSSERLTSGSTSTSRRIDPFGPGRAIVQSPPSPRSGHLTRSAVLSHPVPTIGARGQCEEGQPMRAETRALLDDPEVGLRGVYLAGPSGFNDAGRLWHETVLLPRVRDAGLLPLD